MKKKKKKMNYLSKKNKKENRVNLTSKEFQGLRRGKLYYNRH